VLGVIGHLAPAVNKFLKTKKIACSDEEAELAKELAKELYGQSLDQFVQDGWLSGRHPVTASSATKCRLQSWFKHNQFPTEPPQPRRNAVFRIGNIVELELMLMAILAGEKISDYQHQAKIERAGWPTNNYLDFIHTSGKDGKRRVVDCKTMASFGFQKLFDWGDPMDDTFGYLGQMSNYIDYALGAGLVDSDEGIFLCFKKDTGHVDEYVVKLDQTLIQKSETNSKIIQDHTEYEECTECDNGTQHSKDADGEDRSVRCVRCVGLPLVKIGAADARRPPREDAYSAVQDKKTGDWKLGLVCSYCDYKFSCWTRPWQRVMFNEKDKPVYDESPEQFLETVIDRRGKPQFHVKRGASN